MSDLIDRKAILKKIDNIRHSVQMMDDTRRASIVMNGMHLCEEAVRNQPSAEPERKTGKWIAHPGGKFVGFPYMHYECDQCRDFEPEERNFCPNCGAKMEVKHAAD